LEVIQSTGYHPNAAARTLASQHSLTLGLLLPHSVSFFFTDPYYPQLTKGVAQACNQYGYTLALFLVDSKEDEEKIFPRVSRKGLLDGVIVQSGHHGDQEIIGHLVDASMPVVVAGRPFRSDNVSYIDIDNVGAAYKAVEHLIGLGCRRIGTISGPVSSTAGIDRKEGYLSAMADHALTPDDALIAEGDFTEAGGYTAMQSLLPARPDAIFAASDIMAVGAMRAVQEAKLSIPDDIAFVGFDDLPLASMPNIQLTTMQQSVSLFGSKAVEVLIDLIENGIHPPRHVIMDADLVIRDSCGASKQKVRL
jgi:LacI family transcriptional regulator